MTRMRIARVLCLVAAGAAVGSLALAGAETLARHGIGSGGAAVGGAVGAGSPQGAALLRQRAPARNPQDPQSWGKVGRNESCPCGSGKKFKHCHGRYV